MRNDKATIYCGPKAADIGYVQPINPPPIDPEPEPPTGDEAAFVLYATTLPEMHHDHAWVTSGANNVIDNSAYYANIYSAAGKTFNEMHGIWGNIADGGTYKGITPRDEATHVAVNNGNWSDPNTWNTDTVPGAGAKVLISRTKTVTYDLNSATAIGWIRVDGTMLFNVSANRRLVVDTWTVDMGGTLRIGTASSPVPANVQILIQFPGGSDIDVSYDPLLFSRGLLSEGLVEIHGAPKTAWGHVVGSPMAGATSITLDFDPTGWAVGDVFVLSGTWLRGWYWSGSATTHQEPQDEVLVVTGIAGRVISFVRYFSEPTTSIAGSTVGLRHNHDVARTVSANGNKTTATVANLTRNILFETPEGGAYNNASPLVPHHQRGHIMFMHSPWIDIRWASAKSLGRTNKSIRGFPTLAQTTFQNFSRTITYSVVPHTSSSNVQGRYSWHLHRAGFAPEPEGCPVTGDVICACNKAVMQGLVAWDNPGWGFSHHSSNADLDQCVAWNHFGSGFMAESGDEIGVWSNNWAGTRLSGTHYEKEGSDEDSIDNGKFASGYWFAGRAVFLNRCHVASGNTAWVWNSRAARQNPVLSLLPENDVFWGTTSTVKVKVDNAIIPEFEHCTAMCVQTGLQVIKQAPNQTHDLRSLFIDSTVSECWQGWTPTYTGHYSFLRCDAYGYRTKAGVRPGRGDMGWRVDINNADVAATDCYAENFLYGFWVARASTPEFQGKGIHIFANLTAVNCTHQWAVGPLTSVNGFSAGGNFSTINSTPETVNWLTYVEAGGIVPGRLQYTRTENLWSQTTVDDPDWTRVFNGTKLDSLGSRPYAQPRAWNGPDPNAFLARIQQAGYYTSAAGQRVVMIPMWVADRRNGEYIKFDMPLIYDIPPATWNQYQFPTPWPNLGPLPAALEAKLPVGSTWVAGVDATIQPHVFR
jgi:hypothetical protein